MTTYRLAREDEDESLSRILYNAFLPNWDINWWQARRSSLRPLSTSPESFGERLTSAERARLNFHRAAIAFNRQIGGTIAVAVPPGSDVPAAVLCWLPPDSKATLGSIVRSGFLSALFSFGPKSIYRRVSFERAMEKLSSRALMPLGYQSKQEGAFVQLIATDPEHRGNGFATDLLQWQIERHNKAYPDVPIFLTTTNGYSVDVYERLGFYELGRQRLKIDRSSVMEQNRDTDFLQVVMVWEDPAEKKSLSDESF